MSIITYILYFILVNILFRHPYILVILVLLYVFRDRIPNPSDWVRRSQTYSRLKRTVEVNPYDSTARRDLGMVLLEKKMPQDALAHFLEALKKEPDSAEVNHFAGLAYLRSGNAGEAEKRLKKASELEPRLRYGESWLYLGEAEIALGKFDSALESLKKHLSINNTSIEGLYQYARALNALGKKDEARKAIEDGIRYHKGNPSFRRRRDWRSYVKLKHFRP